MKNIDLDMVFQNEVV